MSCKKLYISVLTLLLASGAIAQNYHAIQGSSMAGALGVHNNPSSIVNTPFKWDVALIGVQGKVSTNAVSIRNYSLLSPPSGSEYFFAGSGKRFAISSVNVNLLNTRIALNRRHAIAFGANLRNYVNIRTGDYDYRDSLKTIGDFFTRNERNQPMSGDMINSGWIELFASYALTIFDNEVNRLNAGLTVKLSRGISGAHLGISNGTFSRVGTANPPLYNLNDANIRYGYSSNYDRWANGNTTAQNLRNFFRFTEGGASIDAGAEWIIKSQSVPSYDADDDYFDYEWKLGLSFLDVGVNQFKYGLQSRAINGVQTNVNNVTLSEKFDSTVRSLRIFNDSLSTIAGQYLPLAGIFRVINPTRMVLNADRALGNNFFVNGELSVNLSGMFGKKWFYVKEMNLLTVTPRWETRAFGVYMPMTFNTENQFWIGGAVKAGPLLIGLHNLAYIVSKKSITKGGGYLALIIRSPRLSGKKRDKSLDCPPGMKL
jgi:hypothetical protein